MPPGPTTRDVLCDMPAPARLVVWGESSFGGLEAAALYGAMRAAVSPLASGQWYAAWPMLRLRLVGTGLVTVDARDRLGNIEPAVASYTAAAATNQIEYPYLGDTAVDLRVTITGSLVVEML